MPQSKSTVEIERRAVAPISIEDALFHSLIPSLAHRRCDHRYISLPQAVSDRFVAIILKQPTPGFGRQEPVGPPPPSNESSRPLADLHERPH
jgi:hypothetical protein